MCIRDSNYCGRVNSKASWHENSWEEILQQQIVHIIVGCGMDTIFHEIYIKIACNQTWLVACWKARGRLSIRVNGTFFAVYYGSRVMSRNVYSSAVFTGG